MKLHIISEIVMVRPSTIIERVQPCVTIGSVSVLKQDLACTARIRTVVIDITIVTNRELDLRRVEELVSVSTH